MGLSQQPETEYFQVKGDRFPRSRCSRQVSAASTSASLASVVVNDQLTAVDHDSSLLLSGARLLYALRILRSHGIPTPTLLHDVFRATLVAIRSPTALQLGLGSARLQIECVSILFIRMQRIRIF